MCWGKQTLLLVRDKAVVVREDWGTELTALPQSVPILTIRWISTEIAFLSLTHGQSESVCSQEMFNTRGWPWPGFHTSGHSPSIGWFTEQEYHSQSQLLKWDLPTVVSKPKPSTLSPKIASLVDFYLADMQPSWRLGNGEREIEDAFERGKCSDIVSHWQ